jgi:energy-coupling factor transporter ATP-binding protein EcfA2
MQREIEITDAAVVRKLRFDVGEEGVTVLLGANATGKSTALRAISSLVNPEVRGVVEHSDGAVAGEAKGFGAAVRFGRNTTRSGELEVMGLEGRFNVADLVDPKIKSPEAADAKRIKALIQLSGDVTADPRLFYSLLGGQEAFAEHVSPKALKYPDVVQMAGAIKRDLEGKALALESEAERESIAAESDRLAVVGVNVNAIDDKETLDADLELAIQEQADLKARAKSALDAETAAAKARQALQEAGSGYKGISSAAAAANVLSAAKEVDEQRGQLADIDQQIAALQSKRAATVQRIASKTLAHEAALTAQQTADAHEATLAQWRLTLEASLPAKVTEEQLAEAAQYVSAVREAVDQGTLVRDAKRRLKLADGHANAAAKLRTQADKLREAAQGTDNVLSDAVAGLGCPLSVSHGRLVTPTERSKTELFADLSRGQQWMLAMQIAIKAVGRGGLLVIDQECWEGVDDEHKLIIGNELVGTGVVLITAHHAPGGLRAESFAA